MIIGRSDEIKDNREYVSQERLFIVTQHVQNVETLTSTQNDQLKHSLLYDETSTSTMNTPVHGRDRNCVARLEVGGALGRTVLTVLVQRHKTQTSRFRMRKVILNSINKIAA